MEENEIYVYLFTGFLESGKTSLIQGTIEEPEFLNGEKGGSILPPLYQSVCIPGFARSFVLSR